MKPFFFIMDSTAETFWKQSIQLLPNNEKTWIKRKLKLLLITNSQYAAYVETQKTSKISDNDERQSRNGRSQKIQASVRQKT